MKFRYLFVFVLLCFIFSSNQIYAVGENWLTGWSYRKVIAIDHEKVGGGSEDELNFPVLISLTGLTNIQDNGADIRFTTDDGNTQIPREIESYSDGTLVAWVKVPVVSHTTDTTIYMYYGNTSATEPIATSDYGSQKVWTNSFNGVWHLGSSLTTDSTSNENDGTNNGVTLSTGRIGGAGNFDGNSYISIPNNESLNPSQFSVEFWMNTNTVKESSWNSFFSKENWNASEGWFFYRGAVDSDPNVFGFVRSQHDVPKDTGATITNGWHHVVGTYNGSTTMELFIDGSSESIKTNLIGENSLFASDVPLYFGARHDNDGTGAKDFAIGDMDEIRYSSTVRSAGWIATVYNNQNSPSTFAVSEDQETAPTSTPTVIQPNTQSPSGWSALSCTDSAPVLVPDLFQIDTTPKTAKLFFTPIDYNQFYISFSTNPKAEMYGEQVSLLREGVQSHTIYHLQPNTTYYIKVRGQNGCMPGNWSNVMKFTTNSQIYYKKFSPSNNLSSNLITKASSKLIPLPTITPESTPIVTQTPKPSPAASDQPTKNCFLWWCW